MRNRNIVRAVVVVGVIGITCQVSQAASFRDVGTSCVVRDSWAEEQMIGSHACMAPVEMKDGRGICSAPVIRVTSGIAYFNANTRTHAARRNLCTGANGIVPVSYLLARLPR
jgi:hypothetical protein